MLQRNQSCNAPEKFFEFFAKFAHFWYKIARQRLVFGPETLKVVIHVPLGPKDHIKIEP